MARTSTYYLVGNDKTLFQIRGFVSCKWQAGNLTSKPITHYRKQKCPGISNRRRGLFQQDLRLQFPMPDLIGSMKIWFESRTTVCFLSLQSHELLLFDRFPIDWPCFAIVLLRIEIIVLYESIKWRVSMVGGGGYQGESDHQFNPAMAPFWELGVRGGIYTWDWQIEVIIIVICLSSWDSLYSVSSLLL